MPTEPYASARTVYWIVNTGPRTPDWHAGAMDTVAPCIESVMPSAGIAGS